MSNSDKKMFEVITQSGQRGILYAGYKPRTDCKYQMYVQQDDNYFIYESTYIKCVLVASYNIYTLDEQQNTTKLKQGLTEEEKDLFLKDEDNQSKDFYIEKLLLDDDLIPMFLIIMEVNNSTSFKILERHIIDDEFLAKNDLTLQILKDEYL